MLGNSQTDTKMNAEDTLSGFQDFLIQLIINDRANKKIKKEKNKQYQMGLEPSTYTLGHLERRTR